VSGTRFVRAGEFTCRSSIWVQGAEIPNFLTIRSATYKYICYSIVHNIMQERNSQENLALVRNKQFRKRVSVHHSWQNLLLHI